MTVFRTKLFAAAAFAAALAAIPGSAGAAEVSIHYYPYELETAQGVGALLARVERTVRHACEADSPNGPLREQTTCSDQLTRQIVGKIGRAPLTALFMRRSTTQVALNH